MQLRGSSTPGQGARAHSGVRSSAALTNGGNANPSEQLVAEVLLRRRCLAPGKHVGEPPVGERAEEGVPGELRASRRRARDAGEKSRLLSRGAERVRVGVAQRRERIDVDARLDRRLRLRLGKLLRAPRQAVAAVPATLRARLAEVADEAAHLAAVMRDEREHALDPVGLRSLSPSEAFEQAIDELGVGVRTAKERVALAQLGGLQLDQALLVEVLERGDDPAAHLAELRCRVLGCKGRPGPARLACTDQAAQERSARFVEAAENLFQRSLAERTQPVARIEGSSLSEHAVELEIGEDRLENERAQVVAHGELVLGDRELRTGG